MTSPIGVFDSGLGGLSVARRILERLPDERIVYFADSAHVPYGERPLEQIQEFALAIVGFLIEKGAKAVVMACNMSSAAALELSRSEYPELPIIGVIAPGAKTAVRVCDGAPIGVLATTGTIRSGAYVRSVAHYDASVPVFGQACPKFVPLIESGRTDSEEAEAAACTYVAPLLAEGCRTIVLGCTHYPFLRRQIEAAAGAGVRVVDPAEETVRVLENTLLGHGLVSAGLDGSHEFYASGDTEGFATLGGAFLGRKIESVEHVDWEQVVSHQTATKNR